MRMTFSVLGSTPGLLRWRKLSGAAPPFLLQAVIGVSGRESSSLAGAIRQAQRESG